MQSLPERCARAARGRDRRAGMLRPHAGSTVSACSRRASRAPALTLCRTRSNEGCSQLSVRPTELELRRSHPVQQVHRAFRCLDRLKLTSHAQRDSPLTMIRVYVYHYTLPVAIGHSSNSRPGLQARPPFCAAIKYPPTGSTLSELASVSGVGGCALKPLGTKRLPGAEGPSETKRKRKRRCSLVPVDLCICEPLPSAHRDAVKGTAGRHAN